MKKITRKLQQVAFATRNTVSSFPFSLPFGGFYCFPLVWRGPLGRIWPRRRGNGEIVKVIFKFEFFVAVERGMW